MRSVFEIGWFQNKMYNYALSFVLGGQILVVNFPVFQPIFNTVALSLKDWIFVIAVTSTVFWAEEFRKSYYTPQTYTRVSKM